MAEGRRVWAACLALVAASGCARLLPLLPPAYAPCREALRLPPARLGADFRWRGRASLRRDGEERAALEIVAEKQGDRLVLVAFDRSGLRLLSVVQEGDALETTAAAGRPPPVAPATLLGDLGRMRAPGATEPDLVVLRDETEAGEPRVTLRDPRCGTEAVYVTTEERALP